MHLRLCRFALVTSLLPAVLAGCGRSEKVPDLAEVHGVVTLDDRPLEGVRLVFEAQGGELGGHSYGLTDAEGRYSLLYKQEYSGAPVGSHVVRIMQDNLADLPTEEWLPMRYGSQSELTAEVRADVVNEIDFHLSSDR